MSRGRGKLAKNHDGFDRNWGWATTIQCQLCQKYEHEHAATLLEVLMARIEEAAKASGTELGLDLTDVEKMKWGMLQVLWIEVAQQWICIRQNGRWCLCRSTSAKAISSKSSELIALALVDRHKHHLPFWRMQIHCCATSIHNTKCRSCVEPFRPYGEDADLTTLRDARVSKASDWASQSSSTDRLLPARAASSYLLESPRTSRHAWACARCPSSFAWNPTLRASPAWKPNEPAALSACGSNAWRTIGWGHSSRHRRAGSRVRMNAYSAMLEQKATCTTCDYRSAFTLPSWTFCEGQNISFRALQQIIHLAASTLDLEVVRQHEDIGKMKGRALDTLVHDSTAALRRFKGEETWVTWS